MSFNHKSNIYYKMCFKLIKNLFLELSRCSGIIEIININVKVMYCTRSQMRTVIGEIDLTSVWN